MSLYNGGELSLNWTFWALYNLVFTAFYGFYLSSQLVSHPVLMEFLANFFVCGVVTNQSIYTAKIFRVTCRKTAVVLWILPQRRECVGCSYKWRKNTYVCQLLQFCERMPLALERFWRGKSGKIITKWLLEWWKLLLNNNSSSLKECLLIAAWIADIYTIFVHFGSTVKARFGEELNPLKGYFRHFERKYVLKIKIGHQHVLSSVL